MSELISMLEDFIEMAAEEDYPIDKVIMSEERATQHIESLKRSLNIMLESIKVEFPQINDFTYKRIIFPYRISPNEKGMVVHDGKEWEFMKCSEYEHGGYEIYLKREK